MNELGNKQEMPGTSWESISQVSPLSHPMANHPPPHYEQVPVLVPTPIRMTPMPEQMIEHDLPPELASQGWRRFWSKRENRPYFWNKISGESLWEMPILKGAFDPITDPLGICDPTQGPHPGQPPGHPLKRRATDELSAIPTKKFILAYV